MLDALKNKAQGWAAKVRPAQAVANDPEASLTEVPSGVSLRGNPGTERWSRKALYVAVASVVGVVSYSLILSGNDPQTAKPTDAGLKPERTVDTGSAWYKNVPDFFVAPADQAAAAANRPLQLPNGAQMPPPPPAVGSMTNGKGAGPDAPPLLAGAGGPALTTAPGQGQVDMRTQRLPMVAWQAGQPITGAGPGQGAPASARLVADPTALNPVQPVAAQQVAGQDANVIPPGGQQSSQGSQFAQASQARPSPYGQGVSPVSKYEIKAGWVIPGVLIDAINSDNPDMVRAQVAENVYDSRSGNYLLIPAGTRLIGTYGAQPAWGQERLQVAWTRMIYPDGTEYDISGMSGSDAAGAAGFADRVNNHYGKLLSTSLLMSVFGVQAQMLAQQNSTVNTGNGQVSAGNALAASAAQQINTTAQRMLQRDLRIAPTIEISPGYRFIIKVNRTFTINKAYAMPAYK